MVSSVFSTGTRLLLRRGRAIKHPTVRWILSIAVLISGIILTGGVINQIFALFPGFDMDAGSTSFDRALAIPASAGVFLIIGATIPAIWLATRVAGLSMARMIAPFSRVSLSRMAASAISTTALVAIVGIPLTLLFDPAATYAPLPKWALAWIPVFIVLIVFQASAEELMFRGYLLQLAGRIFASPWFILVIVGGAFFALHLFNQEAETFGAYAVVDYLLSSVVFTLITLQTGRMEYAIGSHIGWNWSLFIFDSTAHPEIFIGLGIFQSPTVPGLEGVASSVMIHALLYLLLWAIHRRFTRTS